VELGLTTLGSALGSAGFTPLWFGLPGIRLAGIRLSASRLPEVSMAWVSTRA
jgi:hypothetical protein